MAGGLLGRLGAGVAEMCSCVFPCVTVREEVMPDYAGLPRRYRPPKKKLSHISEGRESAFTRTTIQLPQRLDADSIAHHNEEQVEPNRFYAANSQSLPSSTPAGADGRRDSGNGKSGDSFSPHMSSTPHLSSSAEGSHRRSSTDNGTSQRQSMEATRPSFETVRSGVTHTAESIHSGCSWVPDLPTPEEIHQRRRRSTDMLGGQNAARQRSWAGRDALTSVHELLSPQAEATARGDPHTRLESYLEEQGRRAPLDARRRRLTRAIKAPEKEPNEVMPTSGLVEGPPPP